MLDHAKGNSTEPRNFLRVLKQIPEGVWVVVCIICWSTFFSYFFLCVCARVLSVYTLQTAGALGLLDPVQPSEELLLAVKIQDFHRFLLEHLNKEAQSDLVERHERSLKALASSHGSAPPAPLPHNRSPALSASAASASASASPSHQVQAPYQQVYSPLRLPQPPSVLPNPALALGASATSTSTASSASASAASASNPTAAGAGAAAQNALPPNVIETLFGSRIEQRTFCLGGKHETVRHTNVFHYKLVYPTTRVSTGQLRCVSCA
jgi:hypothetical protein